MKFLSWNISGLNKSQKQYTLRKCILVEEVDYICIQETKMIDKKIIKLVDKLSPGASFLHLEVEGALGGIQTMQNPNVLTGREVHKEKNFMIIELRKDKMLWNLVNIYTVNARVGRCKAWGTLTPPYTPWKKSIGKYEGQKYYVHGGH